MKHLFLIIILIIPYFLFGQQDDYTDKLFLKNGSILIGKVKAFNGSDSLTFTISDKYRMTFYGKNDIKAVKKVVMTGAEVKSNEIFQFADASFYFRSQFSLLHSKQKDGYSLTLSSGYRIKPWLSLGRWWH